MTQVEITNALVEKKDGRHFSHWKTVSEFYEQEEKWANEEGVYEIGRYSREIGDITIVYIGRADNLVYRLHRHLNGDEDSDIGEYLGNLKSLRDIRIRLMVHPDPAGMEALLLIDPKLGGRPKFNNQFELEQLPQELRKKLEDRGYFD